MERLEKKLAGYGLVELSSFLFSTTPTWDFLFIPQQTKHQSELHMRELLNRVVLTVEGKGMSFI